MAKQLIFTATVNNDGRKKLRDAVKAVKIMPQYGGLDDEGLQDYMRNNCSFVSNRDGTVHQVKILDELFTMDEILHHVEEGCDSQFVPSCMLLTDRERGGRKKKVADATEEETANAEASAE